MNAVARVTVGQVWESRDLQYEPGRRVAIVAYDGADNGFADCQCVANPRRPERVGTCSRIRENTLRRRWRLTEDATR